MLYGVTNIFLYIESLRVVDLLRKGVYNLKVKVFQENEVTNIAKPTIIQTPKLNKDYSHIIKEHEILNTHYYSSKKFFVQYVNEFFLFGNFVSFQIELPLYNYYSNNVIIDFELVYYPTDEDSTESIPTYSSMSSSSQPQEKVVSQQRIRINKAGYGVHQYIPITFCDLYFCLFRVMIATSLVDIKFRHQSIESLINFNTLNLNPTTPPHQSQNHNNLNISDNSINYANSHQSNESLLSTSPSSSSSFSSSPTIKSSSSSPSLNSINNNVNSSTSNISSTNGSTSSSLSSLPSISNNNNINNITISPIGTSPKLLRQKIGRLSLSMGQIHSSPLEEDFLNDFFDYKYPEVLSFYVESYYRLSNKHKVLLSLLKQSQLIALGESVTNIPPLNIPPFSRHIFNDNSNTSSPLQQPTAQQSSSPQTQLPKLYSNKSMNITNNRKKSFLRNSQEISNQIISDYMTTQDNANNSNLSPTSSVSSFSPTNLNNSLNNIPTLNNYQNNLPHSHYSLPVANYIQSQNNIIMKWKTILLNFQNLSEQITKLWNNFIVVYQMVSREYCFRSSINYEKKCIDKWGFRVQKMVQYIQSADDLLLSDTSIPSSCFLSTNPTFFNYKPFKIQHIPLKPDSVYHSMPIFFEHILKIHKEQIEEDQQQQQKSKQQLIQAQQDSESSFNNKFNVPSTTQQFKHLFVFVHGLSGSSYDLRQFKNYFQLHFPNFVFLICSSIEENTLEDIQQMGEKIAQELHEYLYENNLMQIAKISFLGHSLGGLVVRSALTSNKLKPYLSKLHSYISLSSPHLGTKSVSSTSIVTSALWVWQKFTSSTCLKQLLMQDAPNLTDCYLYKLSQAKSFEYFQYVFLISSEQDGYVPYHSARIEVPKVDSGKENSSKHIQTLKKMVQNLLDPIRLNTSSKTSTSFTKSNGSSLLSFIGNSSFQSSNNNGGTISSREQQIKSLPRFIKINVIFEAHKGVDGVIGRSAHIRMLDQIWFMQMLVQLYKQHWEN
ncbi:hypothetical protein DICPUDRAFT_88808 [Dictyostelium purpureum]|uniref:DUF676 domain-containing protein n=1 Tax=Dictyostelium purpureum TaxID=5786 RepID=F0ZRS2_DICPU|nr:uncharacterized protein DICPUDRAFT_88808 [Dictyostelium purpureum]EGC33368.1 hypothetical protein DICPUDRAFT_88808 [Dictyostelium purpureum]|eukprot:XP_003290119.1 hypothetical protein DICPUDRAFT_88808 [Dictyostelium purpureum]